MIIEQIVNWVVELFVELFSEWRYSEKAAGKTCYTKTSDFGVCESRGFKVLIKSSRDHKHTALTKPYRKLLD